MQFLIIGKDGDDEDAMSRRLASREAHIALGNKMEEDGTRWYGAVLYNDAGKMNGSMAVLDFQTEKELEDYLSIEPYIIGNVWKTIEVNKCNIKNPWKFNRDKDFFLKRGYKNND